MIKKLLTFSIILGFNWFYTFCFSLSTQELTKKLFAGPSAAIDNNYPNGKKSIFRKVKFNGKPDLTGFRLDFVDTKGNFGNRNEWYLTAADVNGQPVELKGCFKYRIENNQLVIDLYKIDKHTYQNIQVNNKHKLGEDRSDFDSWVINDSTKDDFGKSAVLRVPLTDELLTKQIIFIDSKRTNLDTVLKEIGDFGAPYHLLKQEDCIVGELRTIKKVKNLFEEYYSVLENCSYLTMRYMHRELTPNNESIVASPKTMYNNK